VELATLGSSFDTVLYVRSDSCTGDEVECDDDGGDDLDSYIGRDLTAGTYYVFLDGYDEYDAGAFRLEVTIGSP
jgi:hypothetical protein